MKDLRVEVQSVVEIAELEHIAYLQVASTRIEPDEQSSPPDDTAEDTFGFALKLAQSENLDQLIVRLKTSVESPTHDTTVEVGAIYSIDPPSEIAESVRLEFANLVGIMALLPFVREAVADVTRRTTGHPVTMPMIKAGELRFEND